MTDYGAIISGELIRYRITPKNKGYYYIRDILDFLLTNRRGSPNLKRDIYPQLMQKYGKSMSAIEKSITLCIENTVMRSDIDFLTEEFGELFDRATGKLKNKSFIMLLYHKLLLKIV